MRLVGAGLEGGLVGRADELGELLGVGLDEVDADAVGDERGERGARGVGGDARRGRTRTPRRGAHRVDDADVEAVGDAGRQGSREHEPVGADRAPRR